MNYFSIFSFDFLAPIRLWAIPGAVCFFLCFGISVIRKQQMLRRGLFAREFISKSDIPGLGWKHGSIIFFAVAAVSFALAWSRPIFLQDVVIPRSGGFRIAYIIDVSRSMDVSDVHDDGVLRTRIDAALLFVREMERSLSVDRELGGSYPRTIIAFAGAAVSYGGFSSSPTFMHELLSMVSTQGMIGKQGSDLIGVFGVYKELLDRYPGEGEKTVDIAFVLSDGGNDPGGFVIDIAKLEESLGQLRGRAIIVPVGFGSNTLATIPSRNPDGTRGGELKRPDGTPWLSGFDEEIMAGIGSERNSCMRLAPSMEARRCRGFPSVAHLVASAKERISLNRTALPPVVERHRLPAERWFLMAGLFFVLLGLLCERSHALLRRSSDERPLREVLFDDTLEQ